MTSIPERGGNRLAQVLEARFCLVIGPRHRRCDGGGANAERWSGCSGDLTATWGRVEGKLGLSAWRCVLLRRCVRGANPPVTTEARGRQVPSRGR